MATIAWFYISITFLGGGYVGHKVTKLHYKRQIKKLTQLHKDIRNP